MNRNGWWSGWEHVQECLLQERQHEPRMQDQKVKRCQHWCHQPVQGRLTNERLLATKTTIVNICELGNYLKHTLNISVRSSSALYINQYWGSFLHVVMESIPSILETTLLCLTQRRTNGHGNDDIIWVLSLQSSQPFRRSRSKVRHKLLDTIHFN